ncbi:hypothetical protein SHELI_v1c09050 [Spiroplasma helicoides]|uniref:Lipoprotein-associated type-17 domain-containing protein n=1 Tax=Spiroplasma helicoides TaxID=216938 RepID=A0A1B3SLP7_9MOLU|nr:hypothetical protein [Spiroplasma helicoides]AOG60854.1 hypothetical protein SHELI_v1c09050 [Spiroplasma helicoides]
MKKLLILLTSLCITSTSLSSVLGCKFFTSTFEQEEENNQSNNNKDRRTDLNRLDNSLKYLSPAVDDLEVIKTQIFFVYYEDYTHFDLESDVEFIDYIPAKEKKDGFITIKALDISDTVKGKATFVVKSTNFGGTLINNMKNTDLYPNGNTFEFAKNFVDNELRVFSKAFQNEKNMKLYYHEYEYVEPTKENPGKLKVTVEKADTIAGTVTFKVFYYEENDGKNKAQLSRLTDYDDTTLYFIDNKEDVYLEKAIEKIKQLFNVTLENKTITKENDFDYDFRFADFNYSGYIALTAKKTSLLLAGRVVFRIEKGDHRLGLNEYFPKEKLEIKTEQVDFDSVSKIIKQSMLEIFNDVVIDKDYIINKDSYNPPTTNGEPVDLVVKAAEDSELISGEMTFKITYTGKLAEFKLNSEGYIEGSPWNFVQYEEKSYMVRVINGDYKTMIRFDLHSRIYLEIYGKITITQDPNDGNLFKVTYHIDTDSFSSTEFKMIYGSTEKNEGKIQGKIKIYSKNKN